MSPTSRKSGGIFRVAARPVQFRWVMSSFWLLLFVVMRAGGRYQKSSQSQNLRQYFGTTAKGGENRDNHLTFRSPLRRSLAHAFQKKKLPSYHLNLRSFPGSALRIIFDAEGSGRECFERKDRARMQRTKAEEEQKRKQLCGKEEESEG